MNFGVKLIWGGQNRGEFFLKQNEKILSLFREAGTELPEERELVLRQLFGSVVDRIQLSMT